MALTAGGSPVSQAALARGHFSATRCLGRAWYPGGADNGMQDDGCSDAGDDDDGDDGDGKVKTAPMLITPMAMVVSTRR